MADDNDIDMNLLFTVKERGQRGMFGMVTATSLKSLAFAI